MRPLQTPLILGLLAAAPLTANAQQSWGGTPPSAWADLAPLGAWERLGGVDNAALLAEDAARAGGPLRYGVVIDAPFDLSGSGQWDVVSGGLVWRLGLSSGSAYSLGLEFDRLSLPEGAELYVLSGDGEQVLGAYNQRNERPDGGFAVEPVAGDRAIIELFLPDWAEAQARLSLGHVIHDYRNLFALENGTAGFSSGDGGCSIDANCAAGDPYDLEKRMTVRTLSGGILCSAALINNTANDGTGYLVTANQCGQNANTIVRFGYERPDCNTGTAPTTKNLSGVTFLSADPVTDSALYELTSPIPLSYEPAFSGWSRSGTAPTLGVTLHHPFGGPKAIAIDNDGGTGGQIIIQGVGAVLAWAMECQVGGTETGSEGAALWDQNGFLRGVNVGSPVGSCANAYYGGFQLFYENAALSQWLDPLGLDPQSIGAFDAVNPNGVSEPQISGVTPSVIEAIAIDGQSVIIEGVGFNGTSEVRVNGVALEVLPPQYQVLSDTQIEVQVAPPAALGPLTLEVIDADGSDTVTVTVVANAVPTLELANSDPNFLLSAINAQIYVGSQPGDVVFLQASATLEPSILPGVVSLDIGAFFTDLADLGVFVIPPTTGYILVEAPLPNDLPPGIQVFTQAAVVPALNPVLPALVTNFQSGTVLF